MTTKQDVINDEYKFQRACSAFVQRNVIYCVSSLIYELREVYENLDDSETYMTLTQGKPDYEEAARYFIMDEADLDDLENVVESWGYWDDFLAEVKGAYKNPDMGILKPYTVTYTNADGDEGEFEVWATDAENATYQCLNAFPGVTIESTEDRDELIDDWCEANPGLEKAIREACWQQTFNYEEVCNDHNLDPEYGEIYEHWIVDRYFGARLQERGEIVEDYLGMLIWGRTTTGQAISMDEVIQEMVKDLDEDHWIWKDAL